MYNNFSSKKTKKVISALLATALVATSAPISADAATAKVVGVGKTITYNAKATVKKVTVKNKKIVTAKKSGKKVTIKGKKAGKTTVTIKTTKKTIKLTVKVGATKITKKTVTTSMVAGTTKALKVNAVNGKGDTIKFTSSNKSTVKVNKASAKANSKKVAGTTVTALKAGTAKIKATSKYTGKSKTFTITVVDATPTVTPSTNPAIVATTPAATANTNPGTNPGGSTTNAPQTTSGAATTTPGSTDVANTNAPSSTDVVETPAASAEATIAPSFDPATATQGAITVNTNVSGASIKVLSGETTIASVTQEGTKTSATTSVIAPGVYTVEISKKGYDTVTKSVTVNGDVSIDVTLEKSIETGANVKIENELAGFENTVLVNDNAIVTVTMKDKDGNPVANKVVVLSLGTPTLTGGADLQVEVKGQNVATTDANGKATFVVGTKRTNVKVTDLNYRESVKYTATVLGENAVATGSIGFAAIDVGNVAVSDGTDTYDYSNLKAGTSAKNASYTNGAGVVAGTRNAANKPAEYVLSQQVSSEENDNSVQFNIVPKIALPEMANNNDKADEFIQPVDLVSGKYHTYSDAEEVIPLKVDTSKLTYATLNFDKLQLSPYSELKIEFYKKADTTKVENKLGTSGNNYTEYDVTVDADDVEGLEKNNFAVQIPLTNDPVKAVKVTLLSAGQVQTDMNDGYSIKNITGVYNGYSGDAAKNELLSSAKITWEAVAPTYSEPKPLSFADATDADGLGIKEAYSDDTFSYEVPVFPYTGNAIITEKDTNGKVVAYYLVPTENQIAVANKENTNDIAVRASGKYKKAYKATEQEIKNFITTGVTQNENGSLVKVNSEKSGITTLKGTLSIDGIGSDLIDATNRNIYTSVQWNPVEDKEESTASAFLAIAGQKITVTGQLVDKNGNAVSLSGKTINFYQNGSAITSADGVTVVKPASTTDTNGQSTIVLSAAQFKEYTAVTATSDSSDYKVKLSIGGSTVADQADLYWVDADLQFLKAVGEVEDRDGTGKNTTSNNTIEVDVKDPVVGTPWEYGVKTVGGTLESGKLEDYTIDIDGLKIFMASSDSNKGTYTDVENGAVSAESAYVNEDVISAKLTGDSVTGDITFTAKHATKDTLTLKCVGEGTPNMNAKINMNVKWQPKGVSLSLFAPKGTTSKDAYNKLYVKLMDKTGKNPLANTEVTFKSGNTNDKLVNAKDVADTSTSAAIDAAVNAANGGTGATHEVTLTTDKNGVAQIYVKARTITGHNQSSIITATVPSMEQTTSTTLNWLYNETATHELGVVRAAKTDEKQVTVYFNNELNSDTVKPGCFKLTGRDASDTKDVVYDITSVKTKGRSAILTINETLPAGAYTVEVLNNYTSEGINYTVSDIVGQTVTANSTIKFYSTKNATFDLDLNADRDGFVIKNMTSPVSILKTNATTAVADGQTTSDFVITVDGKIIDQSTAFVTYTSASNIFSMDLTDLWASGKLLAGKTVKVYYMGTEESYTISASDITAQVFAKVLADNATVNANTALANTSSTTYLTDNDYTMTAKVVAYDDDDDDSLYTTAQEAAGTTSDLATILDITADTNANSVPDVLEGVALTKIKTASTTEPDAGKFVKIALTITNKAGKVVGTKTVTLTSGGNSRGFTLS